MNEATAQSAPLTVAIDGPAGAGKSTVAKAVAQQLGFVLVDTGALYRAVALLAQRQQLALDDDAQLARLVANLQVRFVLQHDVNRVFLRPAATAPEEDITQAIRSSAVSHAAAQVAGRPAVRAGLLGVQRQLAQGGNAVLEGRDIGTVVFPAAEVKVFLDASDAIRAKRRFDELRARHEPVDYATVLRELRQRDALDRQRQVAPLRAAATALCLDSSHMAVEQVIATIVHLVRQAQQHG